MLLERLLRESDYVGLTEGKGGGRHIGHKLRVGGEVGRYTRYSQVKVQVCRCAGVTQYCRFALLIPRTGLTTRPLSGTLARR